MITFIFFDNRDKLMKITNIVQINRFNDNKA